MKTFPGVFQIRTWFLIALFCLAMMSLLATAAGASAGRGDKEKLLKKNEHGLSNPGQAVFPLLLSG